MQIISRVRIHRFIVYHNHYPEPASTPGDSVFRAKKKKKKRPPIPLLIFCL